MVAPSLVLHTYNDTSTNTNIESFHHWSHATRVRPPPKDASLRSFLAGDVGAPGSTELAGVVANIAGAARVVPYCTGAPGPSPYPYGSAMCRPWPKGCTKVTLAPTVGFCGGWWRGSCPNCSVSPLDGIGVTALRRAASFLQQYTAHHGWLRKKLLVSGQRHSVNNKRPLTPKSMPPAGDEHAKLKT